MQPQRIAYSDDVLPRLRYQFVHKFVNAANDQRR